MQILYPPLNVISRLVLSKSAGPKMIVIRGYHCTSSFLIYLSYALVCFYRLRY
jgi:hypothetical protein